MRKRRFLLLAGVLVTLNLVLWLASPGFALRTNPLAKFFGPKLVRAEVIDATGSGSTVDWHIDRGVITSLTDTQLTLTELDGRVQPITVAPSTHVLGPTERRMPLARLQLGWRVLVLWQDGRAAKALQVEQRAAAGQAHGGSSGGKAAKVGP
jgi:hypothetical protein